MVNFLRADLPHLKMLFPDMHRVSSGINNLPCLCLNGTRSARYLYNASPNFLGVAERVCHVQTWVSIAFAVAVPPCTANIISRHAEQRHATTHAQLNFEISNRVLVRNTEMQVVLFSFFFACINRPDPRDASDKLCTASMLATRHFFQDDLLHACTTTPRY
jgi:hypothetical protein